MPKLARRSSQSALALALSATFALPAMAVAGEPINVLILRENGVGSAAQAQPYVDNLVSRTAKLNNWVESSGSYATSQTIAERLITANHPKYGIFTFGAFLKMRTAHKLAVVGKADLSHEGGRQYFVISATEKDLAGCKGKALATNHAEDATYIDNVVAGGAFKLADFRLDKTRRPVQTIKKVVDGEAACALIDDAQLSSLPNIVGGAQLKPVWRSSELPGMIVVSFPEATADQTELFQRNLAKICEGDGKDICGEAGIKSLAKASEKDFAGAIKAYGN